MNALNELWEIGAKVLVEKIKPINKPFYTQEEFKNNYGKIMILQGLKTKVEKHLIK